MTNHSRMSGAPTGGPMAALEPVGAIVPRVLAEALTGEQLAKAATFLAGMATATEAQGGTTIILPTRTARRLADALLEAVNRGV